jgi:hypothetical protein
MIFRGLEKEPKERNPETCGYVMTAMHRVEQNYDKRRSRSTASQTMFIAFVQQQLLLL